ncbi:MAG: thioredoxin family protein [Pirellulales bacterium]
MCYERYWQSWLIAAICVLCGGCEIHDVSPGPDASRDETRATNPTLEEGAIAPGRIAFVDGFERGTQMASAQQKPMLLFFTADWCKYCQQMANEVLVQDAVVELSRNFVCVLVDADTEPDVCRRFEVRGFPTIQFVSARGVRLNRITGKQPARLLIAQMNAALHAIARRPDPTRER